MHLSKTLLCCLLLPFIACKKNNGSAGNLSPQISVTDVSFTRDTVNTTLKFILKIEPVTDKTISVNYTTEDGTAKKDVDFIPVSGTLSIASNTAQVTVDVQVIGRKILSGTQQFFLKLNSATNAGIKAAKATATIKNPGYGYILVWSDEFDSTALNTSNWNYETGGGGWGNNELENYTSGTNNAYIDNGNLVIEAKKERLGSNNYTSARLTTKGKKSFTYGKIEIKARLPTTQGIWPALWMLGENIDQVNWPNCGEIDIMESINGQLPSKIYGTAHWGSDNAHQSKGGDYTLPSGSFSDTFHIFSLEWDNNNLTWFIDGNQFYQVGRSAVIGNTYPFDKDFFLILNVAVGGNWPGNPDATSVFPQKMLVDYVRVYQK